jgi:hypothetical protein
MGMAMAMAMAMDRIVAEVRDVFHVLWELHIFKGITIRNYVFYPPFSLAFRDVCFFHYFITTTCSNVLPPPPIGTITLRL